jgi:hypothetical protein
MSQRGQQSTAHEYDKSGACIHCGMYRVNVERLSHECIGSREIEEDRKVAEFAEQNRLNQMEGNDHGE